jgi:hypothetical protein
MYGNYLSRTTSATSINGVTSSTGAFREWVDFDGLVSDLLEAGWREKRRQELYFSVRERQKREFYQKHGRRVCSVGKLEKEGEVVKGKKVEAVKGKEVVVEWERESEEEEEENRGLYEAICYNAGPNWRNEYVANLSLMTQVNVNNGNRRLIRRM